MDIKSEIQSILNQAAEIKRTREQMHREMLEIDRYYKNKRAELARDIAKLEIKIALSEITNDEN